MYFEPTVLQKSHHAWYLAAWASKMYFLCLSFFLCYLWSLLVSFYCFRIHWIFGWVRLEPSLAKDVEDSRLCECLCFRLFSGAKNVAQVTCPAFPRFCVFCIKARSQWSKSGMLYSHWLEVSGRSKAWEVFVFFFGGGEICVAGSRCLGKLLLIPNIPFTCNAVVWSYAFCKLEASKLSLDCSVWTIRRLQRFPIQSQHFSRNSEALHIAASRTLVSGCHRPSTFPTRWRLGFDPDLWTMPVHLCGAIHHQMSNWEVWKIRAMMQSKPSYN